MNWLKLKVPPLIVTVVFALLLWVTPAPYKINNIETLYWIVGLLLFLGCGISILGVLEFKRERTTVNPMLPQDSKSIVTSGIYRFSRNPMYLGFLLWLLSFGIFTRNPLSIISILGFVLYMNYFQITPEETILEENFGDDYLKYKASVRRWI
jgi:protein-S-isoprenylcysteine O-methyltransferase Ste14